jgi:diguanylate cyclase (GGDEF)-like protein/PAS domain S-box-containing protein
MPEGARVDSSRPPTRIQRWLEALPVPVCVKGLNNRFLAANKAFLDLYGLSREAVIGKTVFDLGESPSTAAIHRAQDDEVLKSAERRTYESRIQLRDGTLGHILCHEAPLLDDRGDVAGLIGTVLDVTERRRHREVLEHQANYDSLTGLPNRRLMADRLTRVLSGPRDKSAVAVVFIDLDDFKTVNDSLGHDAGDQLLRHIAGRLQSVVRAVDTVARLSGDEFVLLLHNQHAGVAIQRVMDRLMAEISTPVTVDSRELTITCSAGISVYPQDGSSVDTLLRNADAAMYRAKTLGGNAFRFFTAEMNRSAQERLMLDHGLRLALERQELRLHYQPRVTLRDGRIDAVEALVRWQHPELGLVAPDRFVPFAEESGLIVPIGAWVLREACRQARRWRESGSRVTVAVNLSVREFWAGDLATKVAEALAETGAQPEDLELEVTESMMMRDIEQVITTLRALKALGVTLSVDDFGTGYSSLSYLRRLPVDAIKIDRAFVRDIEAGGPEGKVLTEAMITLGHALHFAVVAEGVETQTQLDFLVTNRCDSVQGYYFGKPVPPDECYFTHLSRDAVSLTAEQVPERA